jgi:hypothetical protein
VRKELEHPKLSFVRYALQLLDVAQHVLNDKFGHTKGREVGANDYLSTVLGCLNMEFLCRAFQVPARAARRRKYIPSAP